MKINGFSLIELMVTVAVVAVLAAVAVPSYKSYRIKTNASNAMHILQDIASIAKLEYTKGTLGQTGLKYKGTAIGLDTPLVIGNIYRASFFGPSSTFDVTTMASNEFVVWVSMNMTGWGMPTTGDAVVMRVTENNGVFTTYCGSWTPDTQWWFDVNYLPKACSCPTVSTYSC